MFVEEEAHHSRPGAPKPYREGYFTRTLSAPKSSRDLCWPFLGHSRQRPGLRWAPQWRPPKGPNKCPARVPPHLWVAGASPSFPFYVTESIQSGIMDLSTTTAFIPSANRITCIHYVKVVS
ncbi:hypothetical protein LIA77_07338 [Sarocladium implicatum]|nr:hypothetical protein LIA77_07338 [Sarocladium implicatum]